MPPVPTAAVAAGSLVLGYLTASQTGVRPLGGVVLAAGGAWCGLSWYRSSGPGNTGMLLGVYLAAFGASHPLAKQIGAWPAVLTVSAVTAATVYAVVDRRRARA